MKNPWEEISLDDYERHMGLGSVMQLQAMNGMMKNQFADYPVKSAMVLGVAGGNGLEHVDPEKYDAVYGVDINARYLEAVKKRYANLDGTLECLCLDLTKDFENLPCIELLIANLLVEYIGYEVFQKTVSHVRPKYVSCIIQINMEETEWVSDSPYIHAFDRLDEVHHQMDEKSLSDAMEKISYSRTKRAEQNLPNGKKLLRLDFVRES